MLDIDKWVDEETDPHRSLNRKAMRQILLAIASSTELSPVMSMKGGLLLAIGYRSHRYTRDIDFSTTRRRQDVNVDEFLNNLDKALKVVSANNEDNLFLGVQTHEIRPSRDEASFPTLKIRIGYAVLNRPGFCGGLIS